MHVKNWPAILLAVLLCLSCAAAAAPAETEPAVRYVIDGRADAEGYVLEIQADGVFAYTGRIALAFDTDKLRLDGPDGVAAFQMAQGLTAVAEVRPEDQLVSSAGGYAGTAWYGGGLDALNGPKTIATLSFRFQDGVSAEDVDASTFRLRAVRPGELGPFNSPASFQGKGDLAPVQYAYLGDAAPCGVSFVYEGSDRVPEPGYAVTFRCRNNLGAPLRGVLELNGEAYEADAAGLVTLTLGDGSYLWRARCAGYGALTGRLEVDGDETVELTFVSDETLVRQAADALAIRYQPGDSARQVRSTLGLDTRTDEDVAVSWQSSQPNVVTREGLVYPPEGSGTEVTLTATLTRGAAKETRTFTVYVCGRAEPRPAGGGPGTADPAKFRDLAGYEWAADAIGKLAAAGIIRGSSETTFSPGAQIRRGDFIALLMRMLDVAGQAETAFDDVPAGSYYFREIAQARALGIAQGTGDGRFRPNDPITRQDMITLTVRAIEKTGYLPASAARDDLSAFSDRGLVSDYARESVSAAVARGLIAGSGGRLNPRGNTTRAETAVFLERIYSAHTT